MPQASRGLCPDSSRLTDLFSTVHARFKTPWLITLVTGLVVGVFAAFLSVGQLADYSNAGTLFAFAAASLGLMILRVTDPNRRRPFKTPLVWLVAPASLIGCLILFISLDGKSRAYSSSGAC